MGDYRLTLRSNVPPADAAIAQHFDQRCLRGGTPNRFDCNPCDTTHGRLVPRRVFASTDAAALDAQDSWPGLRIVHAVESIHSGDSAPTKVEADICYFLSRCADHTDAK